MSFEMVRLVYLALSFCTRLLSPALPTARSLSTRDFYCFLSLTELLFFLFFYIIQAQPHIKHSYVSSYSIQTSCPNRTQPYGTHYNQHYFYSHIAVGDIQPEYAKHFCALHTVYIRSTVCIYDNSLKFTH